MRQLRTGTGAGRLCCILAAIAIAALALCTGCAKRAELKSQPTPMSPAEPTVAEPPAPEEPPAPPEPAEPTKAPAGAPAPGPADQATKPDAAKPAPKKSAAKPADTKQDTWAIPPGPLDDDKYVAIAVKLAAGIGGIPDDQRDANSKRLVVKQVLKEANLTEAEFQTYTEQIAADPARRDHVTEAVEKLLEKRLKTKYRGEVDTESPR